MQPAPPYITIGVVADTHIPDRINELHPALMPALKAARVDRILHAGDVCVNRVLDELGQVAPVSVVRGNRDFMLKPLPPMSRRLTVGGADLVLLHGHGSFITYWLDKVQYVMDGYRFERYRRRMQHAWPDVRAYVFGHTHYPEKRWIDNRLYFNPGSASFGFVKPKRPPSFGLLRIYPDGRLEAEIRLLAGWRPVQGRWSHAGR